MAIEGLAIIGETINDSVPSTQRLLEAGDFDGLVELARMQDERGAAYIDVNVGTRPGSVMAELVGRIQAVTTKPLAIDTPDPQVAQAGLEHTTPSGPVGKKPILNSATMQRVEILDLGRRWPLRPILLVSEHRSTAGRGLATPPKRPTRRPGTSWRRFASDAPGRPTTTASSIPASSPSAATPRAICSGSSRRCNSCEAMPTLAGVHASVGLSNFTVMLPSKRADGSPVKGPLESAFLTKAVPLGLDMVIGSVKRKYEMLPPDHPAMICVEDCLRLGGFDSIHAGFTRFLPAPGSGWAMPCTKPSRISSPTVRW